MAARKSCAHLTWAEAKSRTGNTSSSSKSSLIPKNIDHGKALTAKIIAKNGASRDDLSKEKTYLRRARREEERFQAAAARRKEEKELEKIDARVKPFECAVERMECLATKLQQEEYIVDHPTQDDEPSCMSMDELSRIAECRELQMNEVMGLEAIYDTNQCRVSQSSQMETLAVHIDEWRENDGNDNDSERTLLETIARHPSTCFTLSIQVDGTCENSDLEIAACILLRVSFPNRYPLNDGTNETSNSIPTFSVEYCLATDREAVCNPDKPLESWANLDEPKLLEALEEEARGLLPDPCVYEVVTTCLMERLFEFMTMSVHASYSK